MVGKGKLGKAARSPRPNGEPGTLALTPRAWPPYTTVLPSGVFQVPGFKFRVARTGSQVRCAGLQVLLSLELGAWNLEHSFKSALETWNLSQRGEV